ncbi:ABC transporter ATP-binding protein [uncultured Faecalibaculum sp.]|uniref:ABC transporter ATP-binding protein n=1 Tax=uncultured Faecalibaculum sp. TaxID=1729681 RepID=UPI00260470CB|nr:ABC transporter ATP-binding protein [uncultured Faecalibaculum sp.]
MDPRNAIEVRDMSKYFKINRDKARTLKEKILFFNRGENEIHEVLKDINLSVQKGDTVALIGTNGSGKSTLLKLMTKIIYPNEGTVETNGKLTSLLELGAGFHPDFTGRENIYFNASIFGLTRKDIDCRMEDIISFSELGDAIDDPIRTYSSGMYMRLAFSVAINVDAEILLIDEILAVGDQHFQEKCFKKLEELKNSEKTIVIVTHSLDAVKSLCSRAIWIYKGRLKLDGDPIYVIDEYLKQTAKDNHEERVKAIQSGMDECKGVVYIDTPRDLAVFQKNAGSVPFRGWSITDSPTAKTRYYVDDVEFTEVSHYPRNDVYEAYIEQYPGFMELDHLGWTFDPDLTRLPEGRHKLHVEVSEPDGKKLASRDVVFTVE